MDDAVLYPPDQQGASAIRGSRKLRLLVYPNKGGSTWNGGYAKEIISDGSRTTIGMTVTVNKSSLGIPSASTVVMRNLSEESREIMSLRGLVTEIYIQDPYNTSFQKLFTGTIVSCLSQREGTDIVTAINMVTGIVQLTSTVIGVGFDKAKMGQIFEKFRSELGLRRVRTFRDSTGSDIASRVVDKFYYMGAPYDGLNKLAFQQAFSWSIDENELVIVPDASSTGRIIQISELNGLISAVPILNGPYFIQNGVKVVSYPIPYLQTCDEVRVTSKINAKTVNRKGLRANLLNFNLSTIDNQWTMEATCYLFAPILYNEA